jgi:hypothetical protein
MSRVPELPRELREALEKSGDLPDVPGLGERTERDPTRAEEEAARRQARAVEVAPSSGEGIFGKGSGEGGGEGMGAVTEILLRILVAIEDLPVAIMDEMESRFE